MRLTFEALGHELTLTIGRTEPDEVDDAEPARGEHLGGAFDTAPGTIPGEDERWYQSDRTFGLRG